MVEQGRHSASDIVTAERLLGLAIISTSAEAAGDQISDEDREVLLRLRGNKNGAAGGSGDGSAACSER